VNEKLAYNAETYEGLRPAQRLIRSYLKKIEGPDVAPPMNGGPAIMETIKKTATDQPGAPIGRTIERAAADTPHHFGVPESPQAPISTPRSATMDTANTFKAIQDLRRYAKEDFAKQNSDMGMARLGIAHQLENLIESNLSKTGQQGLLDQFRTARERFAKIYLLERVVNDSTGRVNLPKLASLSDTKAYKGVLTGEFKDAAEFAKAYRKAAQKSTGEAAPRFTVFDGLFGISMIGAGHPWAAAAELGARYGVPKMAEAGMLQNRTPSYQPNAMMRGAPTGSPLLGMLLGNQAQRAPGQ